MQQQSNNPLQNWRNWDTAFQREPKIVRQLTVGRTNESYLIEAGSQLLVLRVNTRNSAELGIDRQRELLILEQASAAGVTPKLHYGSLEHGVVITEFIDGQHWQAPHLTIPDNLCLLMESLTRIHSLDVSTAPFNYKEHVENYWQRLIERNIDIPDALYHRREKILPRLADIPRTNVICHHDPNPMNIIVKTDRIYFLDWEYAALAWQAFDFAAVSIEWDISIDKLPVPSEISTEEIELALDLYLFLCELWSCLQNKAN